MSGFTGYPIMDGDICNLPPMHASTTLKYARILDQGFYLTQLDGHMSYELVRNTFGHYYRFVKNICLLSNTEALVDYVSPKKGKVELKFFNLFTRVLTAPVDDVETSMFVTCMPIIQAPAAVVHDFVMMTNEYLAPNGLILACDIIGNGEFQQPK